jgi:hypothetical protein
VHLNEMHIFEMKQFFEFPDDLNKGRIICTHIDIKEGIPSTRWGHSSAQYNGKLYILGGRNE